jgi:hypothetical protein
MYKVFVLKCYYFPAGVYPVYSLAVSYCVDTQPHGSSKTFECPGSWPRARSVRMFCIYALTVIAMNGKWFCRERIIGYSLLGFIRRVT